MRTSDRQRHRKPSGIMGLSVGTRAQSDTWRHLVPCVDVGFCAAAAQTTWKAKCAGGEGAAAESTPASLFEPKTLNAKRSCQD